MSIESMSEQSTGAAPALSQEASNFILEMFRTNGDPTSLTPNGAIDAEAYDRFMEQNFPNGTQPQPQSPSKTL